MCLVILLCAPGAAEHVSITEHMVNQWFGVGFLRGSWPGYCDPGTARGRRACFYYRTRGKSMVWGAVSARVIAGVKD